MHSTGVRLMIAGVMAGCFVAAAMAEDKPIPDAKQAQLLKKHPELDANKDGKLTRDEVRNLAADKRAPGRKDAPKEGTDAKKLDKAGMMRPDPAKFLANHPDADTNKDGKLSPEEMREYMRAHGDEVRAEIFKNHPELDTNKDGVLSEEEMKAGRAGQDLRARLAEMVLKRFPEADTDKSGRISPEEMKAFMQTHGDQVRSEVLKRRPELDTNKDGTLSQDELQAAMREAGDSPAAKARIAGVILKRFPEADKDKDGKLSDEELKAFRQEHGDEFRTAVLKRFPEADSNADGQLSDDELKTLKEKRGEEGKVAHPGRAKENRPQKKPGTGKKAKADAPVN